LSAADGGWLAAAAGERVAVVGALVWVGVGDAAATV
jgi:hypothetical protein